MNRIRHLILSFTVLFVLLTCLTGCKTKNERYITCIDDMKDMKLKIGYPEDMDLKETIFNVCPGAKLLPQNDVLSINSVVSGKLDCYIAGISYLEGYINEHPDSGLTILEEPIIEYNAAFGLYINTPVENYITRVNQCISELRDNGTLSDMERRWMNGEDETMPDIPLPENPDYILRVVSYGQQKPNTFIVDNQPVGFDIELAYRTAAYLGCGIHIEIANFGSMLMGIAEGKYDMIASDLYIVEDHNDNMAFSDPYHVDPISIIVRADPATITGNGRKGDLGSSFVRGFQNTFVKENRWMMLLSGLGITVVITLGGFVLANVIGAAFCAMQISKRKFWNVFAEIYSGIMQGTPIVVLLMLLYYVVFGKSRLSGTVISIIGFGISFGASLAQIFSGGITAVNKGQKEAALALGFTKAETFFGITFPQAARSILPEYFGTAISLLKLTSIVGYVAVVDLTKASDLIRASTYEAFFPLISTAIIYFIITNLLLFLMKTIKKRLAPKRITETEAVK